MYALQRIHGVAAAEPDRLAIVHNGQPITYGAFWRCIEGRRRSLARYGRPGAFAVCRVTHMVESWILDLALRALDLTTACVQTADQIELFANLDVACTLSLASEPANAEARLPGAPHLVLGPLPTPVDLVHGPLPPPPVPLHAGGHIKLTSGTTGRYKKVPTTFGATEAQVAARLERYIERGDAIRQFGPDTVLNIFNMGLWTGGGYNSALTIWSLGGAVVFEQRAEVHRALDWPTITHTQATPRHLSQLFAQPEGAFPRRPDMQLIIVSGAVPAAMAKEAARRLTPRILINMSSTESGGWASAVADGETSERWYQIDRSRQAQVIDDAGRPLPAGRLGRVRVRLKEGIADGYLDDADATAAAYGDGWFYPGDLGVMDEQGRLSLRGRATDVISLGGEKHPAEPWERTIQDRLGCDAVCILSCVGESGGEELHVFLESRRPIPPAEIASAMRSTLAGFPDCRVHICASLPRTQSGKVRRITLVEQLQAGGLAIDPARRY